MNRSFYVLLQRGWQAGSGIVTLVLLSRLLTAAEQGWYYAFLSVAAVYVVLDFGLSSLLVQISAREFDGLLWTTHGRVEGQNKFVFGALCRRVLVWYGGSALAYLALIPIGLYFFDRADPLPYDWRPAWIATILATSLSQFMLPWPAILEGTGAIREAYLVRLAQGVLGAVAVWVVLSSGGGLYAAVMAPAATFVVALGWIALTKSHWVRLVLATRVAQFHWRGKVFGLQWRMGVTWAAGYVIGQIHVPWLFRTHGAEVAGQMGISLAVMNMLGLLSQSWVVSRLPSMTQQAHRRQWAEMDANFRYGFTLAVVAYLILAAAVMALRFAIEGLSFSERVLPTLELGMLLTAGLCAHIAGLLASQIRTYRRDPFVPVSVVSASLLLILVVILVPRYSAYGAVLSLLIVHGGVSLPWIATLYRRLNTLWRGQSEMASA